MGTAQTNSLNVKAFIFLSSSNALLYRLLRLTATPPTASSASVAGSGM